MILGGMMSLGWGPILFTLQPSDLQHFATWQVVINILEKGGFLFYTVKFKMFTLALKLITAYLQSFTQICYNALLYK